MNKMSLKYLYQFHYSHAVIIIMTVVQLKFANNITFNIIVKSSVTVSTVAIGDKVY